MIANVVFLTGGVLYLAGAILVGNWFYIAAGVCLVIAPLLGIFAPGVASGVFYICGSCGMITGTLLNLLK